MLHWEMEGYQSIRGSKCALQRLGSHEEELGRSRGGWPSDQPSWSQHVREPQNYTENITWFSIFDIMGMC